MLENRAWTKRAWPFLYLHARSVFKEKFFKEMVDQYSSLLAQIDGSPFGVFKRTIPGYDAYGTGFDESLSGPLRVFVTLAWHKMIANLFGVLATNHVNIGAHHHRPGSASGWVHNDFNSVWFPKRAGGELAFPQHKICGYRDGSGSLPDSEKTEVVRAVAMIFYLCNDGWIEGEGGETGLYLSPDDDVLDPCVRIPPEDNSLVLFECTPSSYHTYLCSPRRARNSVIMWLHCSKSDAIAKWGGILERWRL